MVGATENWFYENSELQDWEVGDFLGEILANEFNLEIQDGSLPEVGRKICEFFEVCSKCNEKEIRAKMMTLPRCDLSKSRVEDDDYMDDEDSMDIEESADKIEDLAIKENKEPVVDDDGFQMVTRSMARKKK